MTHKKDRRSARTRKREEADKSAHDLRDHLTHWVTGLDKKGSDITIWYAMDFIDYQLPSLPRSHSSCAPMVPEVSQ